MTIISDHDKTIYRQAASEAILAYLDQRDFNPQLHDALLQLDSANDTCGVFITLKQSGQLRGCIGCITTRQPLHSTVPEFSIKAAIDDPRFPALKRDEFDHTDILLSVLTEPKAVNSYRDIIIGTHGMTYEYNNARSVYLPEVATEQGWDLETTLRSLAQKAGQPAQSFVEAQYTVFESIKF